MFGSQKLTSRSFKVNSHFSNGAGKIETKVQCYRLIVSRSSRSSLGGDESDSISVNDIVAVRSCNNNRKKQLHKKPLSNNKLIQKEKPKLKPKAANQRREQREVEAEVEAELEVAATETETTTATPKTSSTTSTLTHTSVKGQPHAN